MNKIVNKRNGIIAAIVVVIVVGAIIVSTTFTQAMTLDEAKEVAKKYVPATAEFVTSEEEETKFEVVFYDKTNKESFEAEVSTDTKKIKKVESQLDNDLGSKTVKLKKAEVKDIIKEKFGSVTSINVTLNKDNGLYEYGATFKSNEFYGDADVNPETGTVLESTVKYGTAVTIPNDKTNNSKDGLLTYEEVEKAVIKAAGGGSVKDMDLEKYNDEYYYEVELIKDNMEYDYYVNAKTGEVTLESKHEAHLDYDDDDDYYEDVTYPNQGGGATGNNGSTSGGNSGSTSTDRISVEKAKSIVLAKIPGATIYKIKLEMDDGIYVYEGEARLGNYEYDFEINASSGVIIGWEKDRIENDYDDDWDDDDHDDEWDD